MEAAFVVLAEQAPELVARLSGDGVFLFVSTASSTLLGYEPGELVGTVASELIATCDRERIEPLLTLGVHCFAAERRTERGLLRRKDGISVLTELTAYVPREGAAAPHETVLVIRDARREAEREREARERELRVRSLLNALPGMIFQWTSRSVGEREFTFCNDWPRTALGLDLTDLTQLHARLSEITHPADAAEAWQQWQRAAATLEPWVWRGRLLPHTGEVLHVVGHATPQEQADGSVLWSGVLLPDSRQGRVADALTHGEELFGALVANRAKAIDGPVRDGPVRDVTEERKAGKDLVVARETAEAVTLELKPFEIDRVLDSVANVLAVRARERKLEIVFAVDPRVPDELIGDRMRLGQVVMSLVSNAVKVSERGEIVVSVELLSRVDDQARLRFLVRDTGIGMSDEQRKLLFEPFSQVDSSTTRKYGGTGLGLSTSQELVRLMGSEIVVQRRAKLGSEFSFELTLGIPTGERAHKPRLDHNVRDLKVLIVDDNQVARDVLTRNLLAMGFLVCAVPTAETARDALKQAEARSAPFHLALIDVRMPETDGLELARQIGAGRVTTRSPQVVMISAYSRDEISRDEISRDRDLSHVRAFLRKPISRSTLLDTVAELVQGQIVDPPSKPRVTVAAAPNRERKRPLVDLTLLVVEDNEINQILARDLLEAAGAKVVLASDGHQALRAAAAQTPAFDVILMDVQMPGMDGHETTRALRAEAKTSETPIIAMTAHAFDAERKKCLASGMNAHITKPINPSELVQTVLSWGHPSAPSTPLETGRPPSELAPPQSSEVGSRVSQPPAAKSVPQRTAPASLRSRAEQPRPATLRSRAGQPRPASDRPPEQTGFEPSTLAAVFREPARQLAFLRKFVDSARRTLSDLDDAWQRRSHDDISFAGHKLKSSAKACGAHSLATVCADLERFGKQPDWDRLEPLRGLAHSLLDEVAQHVERLEANRAPEAREP